MHLQVTVDVGIGEVDPPRVRAFGIDCKYLHTVSIKAELHLMRFGETLDMFVAVPHQSNLNIVLCIDGKRVVDNRSAARSEGQSVEVVFLREIGRTSTTLEAGVRTGLPMASRLIFCAAARDLSSSVGESPPTLTLSKP